MFIKACVILTRTKKLKFTLTGRLLPLVIPLHHSVSSYYIQRVYLNSHVDSHLICPFALIGGQVHISFPDVNVWFYGTNTHITKEPAQHLS